MYFYNTARTIRTKYPLEKAYADIFGNYLSFILSVEYLQSNGSWNEAGLRWVINCQSKEYVMENGFKEFPHRVS
ncbi:MULTISPECIES: hypothetical protein [Vibrio]|uniref:Uncharacterized protein n=1 Tax=Vibrio atlanticus TaxID=693153 RepID=A0ABV4KQY3_9VIBR|nr:hypothetical protein [Vibrio splendidus]PMI27867.1 hypothetical protein BCU48_17745 [Vibrio splendidus]PMI53604.1 hypothetical protein BCU42_20740 [Vibrio splendidus]PMP38703.1 hypothetical protein BCS86_03105 [Vibrio splendidus]